MSEPTQLPALTPEQQLLADWDAGKPVKLYVARGPEYVNHPNVLVAAKVQMESLRIVLGFRPTNTIVTKWNALSGSTWTAHVDQAVGAAGAQVLAREDAITAAHIGGQYVEQGYNTIVGGPLTATAMVSKGA